VSKLRKFVVLLALAALALPVAACGSDDAADQVDQARKDIRKKAKEIKGNIDDLSKQDLRKALNDAKATAENGSGDAKREARKLQRRIQRELNQRD
jgi:hypothetical protein